jgi:hypothetical protein
VWPQSCKRSFLGRSFAASGHIGSVFAAFPVPQSLQGRQTLCVLAGLQVNCHAVIYCSNYRLFILSKDQRYLQIPQQSQTE